MLEIIYGSYFERYTTEDMKMTSIESKKGI